MSADLYLFVWLQKVSKQKQRTTAECKLEPLWELLARSTNDNRRLWGSAESADHRSALTGIEEHWGDAHDWIGFEDSEIQKKKAKRKKIKKNRSQSKACNWLASLAHCTRPGGKSSPAFTMPGRCSVNIIYRLSCAIGEVRIIDNQIKIRNLNNF